LSVKQIKIVILNHSTVVSDAEVRDATHAMQKQLSNDFGLAWGISAHVSFYPKNKPVPPKTSQLIILDTSDDADALGYHDLTDDGYPLGKVFAKSDLDYGASWTVTLSHELLEMLVDPSINLVVSADDARGNTIFYAYEVCDAVEADEDGYTIDGVQVSNFVLPAYFETFHKPGTKYDFLGLLQGCVPAMRPGGYLSLLRPGSAKGWTQISARENQAPRPRVGSRRERRRTPKEQWVKSVSPSDAANNQLPKPPAGGLAAEGHEPEVDEQQ
jgi:hypothetical protein